MAHEHAESGVVMGLAAAVLAHSSLIVGLAAALLTAGAALLPDLDHPSATAAHTFGPLTTVLAAALDVGGLSIWHATATVHDQPPRDGHRTITHTTAFALLAGAAFGGIAATGLWPLRVVLFVFASLAVRGLAARSPRRGDGTRHRRFHPNAINVSLIAAGLIAAAYFLLPGMDPLFVGECVALGCFTHCLGDSLTLYGCPWLWPIPIAGQRWYLIGLPRPMRFRTGTEEWDGEDFTRWVMHGCVAVLLVLLIPGLSHALGRGIVHVAAALG